MKKAKSGNLHYIFLQAHVNELLISTSKYFRNVSRSRQILLVFPVNSWSVLVLYRKQL